MTDRSGGSTCRCSFPRSLTVLAWEDELRSGRGPLTESGEWSDASIGHGIHLDYSKVEFVDIAALARALLLIDTAVRGGIRVTVTLPTAAPTAAEDDRLATLGGDAGHGMDERRRRIDRHARRRGEARAFMQHVGFVDALHAQHWPPHAASIDDSEPREAYNQVEPAAAGSGSTSVEYEHRRRRLLPFRWLDTTAGDGLRRSDDLREVFAGLCDLGLSSSDARVLSQVVVAELVANTAKHAGDDRLIPHALVGAVLLDSVAYQARRQDLPDQLAPLVDLVASTGSQVLRMLVGDSGVGLVRRPAAGTGAGNHPRTRRIQGRQITRDEDAVLAMFGRPPGSAREESPGSHPHGLWRVSRVVRSYGGSLVSRTGSFMAGMVFGGRAAVHEIALADLGMAHGTLHELTILTDARTVGSPIRWERRPGVPTVQPLRWVDVAFDSELGLSDRDRMRLEEAARAGRQDGGSAGLIVTVPLLQAGRDLGETALLRALHKTLDFFGRLAAATAVVVVFPDADWRIVDLGVAGLGGDENLSGRRPFLVHSAYGPPQWCCTPLALRAVFDSLTGAGGMQPLAAVRETWRARGGEGDAFIEVLGQRLWLRTESDAVLLTVSPDDAVKTLGPEAQVAVAAAVESGRGSVYAGVFRTPTLRIVDRWIDTEGLLAETIGLDLAAYILARRIEAILGPTDQTDLESLAVAQADSAPRRLAHRLSECLSLGGRRYPMPGDFDLDAVSATEGVPRGARVVLCADVLSTENTVRRAVAAIVGRQAEPVVVACAVDTRVNRGPITMLNRTIPVVALAVVAVQDAAAGEGSAVVDIDPIRRQPAGPESSVARAAHAVPEATFLEWCVDVPGALCLGHVERPTRRHLSVYLSLDRLLRERHVSRQIVAAVLRVLIDALTDVRDDAQSVPVQIWYTGATGDYARLLAEPIRDGMRAGGWRIGSLVSVARTVAGSNWRFVAAASSLADDEAVIFVDWGAMSATTVHQVVRLAAGAGASAIVVVVLLDQLADQESQAVAMLRGVAGPHGNIPVVVRFVSSSSIRGFSAQDCAICETRRRYRSNIDDAPERLRRYAGLLDDFLRPRGREELFAGAAVDLFAVPVGPGDAVDYLRWCSLLRRALYDTGARQEVLDQLADLAAGGAAPSRDNLIRLLAAEQQWLKLPPLRFAAARSYLAEICIAGVGRTAASWLRVQALMVMAITVPQQLVEMLPDILSVVLDDAALVDQMFLDCYCLLQRSARDTPVDVGVLRARLRRCRDRLEDDAVGSDTAVSDDHLGTVNALIHLAERPGRPKPADVQSAWDNLREHLWRPVVRHRVESELLRVRGFVDDIADFPPTPERARDARRDWNNCANLLEGRVLTNLDVIWEILAGDYVADSMDPKEHGRLIRLAPPNVTGVRAVTDKLHELTRIPWQPRDQQWQRLRRDLLNRLDWWYRVFLATHVQPGERPALIVDLIGSVPARIGDAIFSAFEKDRVPVCFEDDRSQAEVEVFCPAGLIGQVVEHLMANIRRYTINGATPEVRVAYARPDDGLVEVRVSNTGTAPRGTPGAGISSLNDKLRPFGGSLTGRVVAEGQTTYQATLVVPVWRGAW